MLACPITIAAQQHMPRRSNTTTPTMSPSAGTSPCFISSAGDGAGVDEVGTGDELSWMGPTVGSAVRSSAGVAVGERMGGDDGAGMGSAVGPPGAGVGAGTGVDVGGPRSLRLPYRQYYANRSR